MTARGIRTALCLLAVVLLPLAANAAGVDAVSLVPRDAVSVGLVHVNDLRTSAIVGRLFEQTDEITADGEAWEFMQETGLNPAEDVDTVVFALMPETALGDKGKVLMLFEGRFDPAKLGAAALKREAARVDSPAGAYFRIAPDQGEGEQPVAVSFDRSLVIAGNEEAVLAAMAARKSGGTDFLRASGLGRDYARIEPSATAWLLVDVQRATRLTGAPQMPTGQTGEGAAIAAALKTVSTLAVWGKDAGDALEFEAFALSADSETRQLLEDLLRGAVAAWRMAAQEKKPEFVSILRKFDVNQSRDGVSISGSIPAEFIKTHMKTAAK